MANPPADAAPQPPADAGAVSPQPQKNYESRSPDGDGPVGADSADRVFQPRAGSEPADSLPDAPRPLDLNDIKARFRRHDTGELCREHPDCREVADLIAEVEALRAARDAGSAPQDYSPEQLCPKCGCVKPCGVPFHAEQVTYEGA